MTKITVTIDVDGKKVNVKTPVKKARKLVRASKIADKDQTSADLELRLMTYDAEDEEKQMSLNVDIMTYIDGLLKKGNKVGATKFLNDNKHRFNPDLKDLLIETIRSHN